MSKNGSNSSRQGPKSAPRLLSRISPNEFKALRVAIRRNHITTSKDPGPIERSIEDPKIISQLVHCNVDQFKKPIFDREEVLVNEEHKRFVLADANKLESQSTSPSYSRSRDNSPHKRRSRSNLSNHDARRNNCKDDHRKSPTKSRSRERNVRDLSRRKTGHIDKERAKSPTRNRGYSRSHETVSYRRSRSPLKPGEYRPSHIESRKHAGSNERDTDRHRAYSRRSRSHSREKYKRSTSRKSPSPKYRGSSRKRSHSLGRRSVSPTRGSLDRTRSSKYSDTKNRRSRSPIDSSRSYYGEKRGRERSVERFGKSRSPPKYDKYKRRSRSPIRRSSPGGSRRCSRSPHPPIVTFSRSRSDRRRSRSPIYDREKRYRNLNKDRRKSRSHSPRRRSRSPHKEIKMDEYAYYEGMPGPEYWLGGGPIRPGFPMPRFYPQPFFPRPMPGAPIILPPRIPLLYPPFRPRLPIYNSKMRHRAPATVTSEAEINVSAHKESDTSVSVEQTVSIQEITASSRSEVVSSDDKKITDDNSTDSLPK